MKTLRQAEIGETVRVVKLHGEGAVKRRIMDMGLTKGVEVYLRKVAPLGDPLEITVLKCGTFAEYSKHHPEKMRKINPQPHQIKELMLLQEQVYMLYREEMLYE